MNCDTAFDLLTDAETARSTALARHLESCPRCRQMQETLAPALGFLTLHDEDDSRREFSATRFEVEHGDGRQPKITIEALRIAEQAAIGLATQSASRRDRLQRLAQNGVCYAAVFAAGLLLAVLFFNSRETASPLDGQCTRSDASRSDVERSAAEIRALALSCAACHETPPASGDSRTTSFGSRRSGGFDWVRPLLADETLLAVCERQVLTRAV